MAFLLFLILAVIPECFCKEDQENNSGPSTEDKYIIEPNVISPSNSYQRDCGGVIPISPIFDSHIMYKEGQLYDPGEVCVWILAPQDGVNNVQVTVQQNFPSGKYDGISVYFLNQTGLTGHKLPKTNTDFNFNTPLAFLVFLSYDYQSNGFYIYIRSTGVSGPRSTTAAYHVRKDEGKFSYPMVEDPMRNKRTAVALILQKNHPGWINFLLEINLKNVEIDENDIILMYSLNARGSSELALVGRFTEDAQVEVTGHNPLLTLLESKDTLKKKGFQVEWKIFQDSIK